MKIILENAAPSVEKFKNNINIHATLVSQLNEWLQAQKANLQLPSELTQPIDRIRLSRYAYEPVYAEDGAIKRYNETTEIKKQDIVFEFKNYAGKEAFLAFLTTEMKWDIASEIYNGVKKPVMRGVVADQNLKDTSVAIPISRFEQLISTDYVSTPVFNKMHAHYQNEVQSMINKDVALYEQACNEIAVFESIIETLENADNDSFIIKIKIELHNLDLKIKFSRNVTLSPEIVADLDKLPLERSHSLPAVLDRVNFFGMESFLIENDKVLDIQKTLSNYLEQNPILLLSNYVELFKQFHGLMKDFLKSDFTLSCNSMFDKNDANYLMLKCNSKLADKLATVFPREYFKEEKIDARDPFASFFSKTLAEIGRKETEIKVPINISVMKDITLKLVQENLIRAISSDASPGTSLHSFYNQRRDPEQPYMLSNGMLI